MSLAVLRSRALAGVRAHPVAVEVHLANGLPGFTIVGLPEAEVREARDRVRAAIQNCRFEFPARRITVNLAPADLPKESGRFDLPIALGILIASGQVPAERHRGLDFAGELSLTGALRPVRGALAMAAAVAQEAGHEGLVVPPENADEAALVAGCRVLPATDLLAVAAHLQGESPLGVHRPRGEAVRPTYPDLADVKGQAQAKRALEIAAAGNHSVLMVGPPGTGKSMLAQRFPALLPPMTTEEAMESAVLLSIAGRFDPARWGERVFRAPHHTASAVALVGGGNGPRPGEISLAHRGVLFLDELPEFDRRVLEVLREPLESGRITISRAARQADFPARFQLIAAMNPCPCGYLGHAVRACRCTPEQVERYQGKLSGPLLDRIDMRIDVPALAEGEIAAAPAGEASGAIAARVAAASDRQAARQGKPNALLGSAEIDLHCRPDDAGEAMLRQVTAKLGWSARGYHRVLKLARTIADLEGVPAIRAPHIAEAVQYRRFQPA